MTERNAPTRRPAADPAETAAPQDQATQAAADQAAPDAEETLEQAPAEASAPQTVEEIVDAWFAGFNDTKLSRHPEFWDLVRERLPELKSAIATA